LKDDFAMKSMSQIKDEKKSNAIVNSKTEIAWSWKLVGSGADQLQTSHIESSLTDEFSEPKFRFQKLNVDW